jgi:hypothetical protein
MHITGTECGGHGSAGGWMTHQMAESGRVPVRRNSRFRHVVHVSSPCPPSRFPTSSVVLCRSLRSYAVSLSICMIWVVPRRSHSLILCCLSVCTPGCVVCCPSFSRVAAWTTPQRVAIWPQFLAPCVMTETALDAKVS